MEDDLLKGLAAGDTAAYQRVYDCFGSTLYRTAVRMLGSHQDAEDAVQEVFAAIVRSRGRLAHVADMKAYLFASLRHVAGRIHRRRQQYAMSGLDETHWPNNRQSEDGETAERLWDVVRRLPAEQREVLALKIQGELTFKEIGAVCGISPNTAASRYRYALDKLKQMMETQDDEQ